MKTTTMGQAAGAGGFALAIVTMLIWAASLKGITVPDNVAAAAVTIITMMSHYIVMIVPAFRPPPEPAEPAALAAPASRPVQMGQ